MKPCDKPSHEHLMTQISPELNIQMDFSKEKSKSQKSLVHSPKTLPETPSGLNWLASFKEEFTPSPKLNLEFPDIHSTSKLKGLEEIGLFSEFQFTKKISNMENDEKQKRSAINISDFMLKNNQRNILKNAGGWETYFTKKKEYQKEAFLRAKHIKNFFCPSEKKPEFFYSPQVSPKYKFSSKKVRNDLSKQAPLLDDIIEKCEQAIQIKLPKAMNKSISPRLVDSDSEQKIQKLRIRFSKHKVFV